MQEIYHATGEDVEPEVLAVMHDGIVYKYLVNGEWRTSKSGRTIQNLTPYDETVREAVDPYYTYHIKSPVLLMVIKLVHCLLQLVTGDGVD